MSVIARVFPRRTKATPTDSLAFVGEPGLFAPKVDAVHISVAFSWDLALVERLEWAWRRVAPVSVGGPATGQRGEEFVPGRYLAPGYVITSRGCPNRCWFCDVPKRDGTVRELPIADGWNVLDDNLLACSEGHIRGVFAMLKRQPQRAEFTGGLEAARLKPWHVDLLADLHPRQFFFAFDTPDDYEPLVEAGRMLRAAGFLTRSGGIRHSCRCYVLCGYPRDTMPEAERRMHAAIRAGFMPMAMLWRDRDGKRDLGWMRFSRSWARPAAMSEALRREFGEHVPALEARP